MAVWWHPSHRAFRPRSRLRVESGFSDRSQVPNLSVKLGHTRQQREWIWFLVLKKSLIVFVKIICATS